MGDLAGWPYWKVVSITGQSGAGTDYQVKFEIGDSAGGDFHLEGHCTNFPQDIRITDDDGTTLLDHWVEDLAADPIVVHVEVKDDLGSNQDIRVYYGKSGETTASNGATTFREFSDFDTDIYTDTGSLIYVDTTDSRMEWQANRSSTDHRSKISINEVGNFEFKTTINITSSDGDGGLVWIYLSDTDATYKSSTDAICMAVAEDVANGGYYVFADHYDGGVRTNDAANLYNINTGTDYIVSLRRSGNDITIELQNAAGSVLYTKTWSDTSLGTLTYQQFANLPDNTGAASYIIGWADPMLIKKYNSPEPVFSSAGAEQTPTGVSPTSVFYGPLVGPFGGPI